MDGLLLVGRSGSTVGLSSCLTDGFSSSTVRLTLDFDVSWGGTKQMHKNDYLSKKMDLLFY